MDFFAVVLLLALHYLHPQEWFGMLNKLHPIQLATVVAVWSLISRDQRLRLKDFFRTPHDWMIAAYFAWTIFANPAPWFCFQAICSVILIYSVSVQGLSDLGRIRSLIGWWAVLILIIASLAIASEYGFDPFNSSELTHGRMKDRLVLNLSLYNNPNALAHAIVPVIPMLFFLLFWKRTALKIWLVVLFIPLWCIFLTVSKGAFLCTGAVLLATLCFGRPLAVQAIIVFFAVGFGWAGINQLPRMHELKTAKTDPAIQGRVAAYTFGLQSMRTHFFGLGLGSFRTQFFRHGPLEYPEHPKRIRSMVGGHEVVKIDNRGHHFSKATHGSYNQNGAELGYIGLYLFVGCLYCCMRTVLTANTTTVEEERIRRILFCIILAYAVSSWMVDFCYRPTFFVFVAATGAFHRHLRGLLHWQRKPDDLENKPLPWMRSAHGLAVPALANPGMRGTSRSGSTLLEAPVTENPSSETIPMKIGWSRIGKLDLVLIFFSTWLVIKYWEHLIKTF